MTGFVALSRVVDQADREHLTARLSGGLYLARHNSLLASANLYRGSEIKADLNIYPGVFGDLGGWMTWRQGGQFSVGLTALPLPGLGLGYNSQRFAPR